MRPYRQSSERSLHAWEPPANDPQASSKLPRFFEGLRAQVFFEERYRSLVGFSSRRGVVVLPGIIVEGMAGSGIDDHIELFIGLTHCLFDRRNDLIDPLPHE